MWPLVKARAGRGTVACTVGSIPTVASPGGLDGPALPVEVPHLHRQGVSEKDLLLGSSGASKPGKQTVFTFCLKAREQVTLKSKQGSSPPSMPRQPPVFPKRQPSLTAAPNPHLPGPGLGPNPEHRPGHSVRPSEAPALTQCLPAGPGGAKHIPPSTDACDGRHSRRGHAAWGQQACESLRAPSRQAPS